MVVDRQTDRKTERQKDRKTERQKDRKKDRQTDKVSYRGASLLRNIYLLIINRRKDIYLRDICPREANNCPPLFSQFHPLPPGQTEKEGKKEIYNPVSIGSLSYLILILVFNDHIGWMATSAPATDRCGQ